KGRFVCRAVLGFPESHWTSHRGTHEMPVDYGGTHHVDASAPKLRRDGTTPHGRVASSPPTRKTPPGGGSPTIGWYFSGLMRPRQMACRTSTATLSACIFSMISAR